MDPRKLDAEAVRHIREVWAERERLRRESMAAEQARRAAIAKLRRLPNITTMARKYGVCAPTIHQVAQFGRYKEIR